MEKRVLEFLRNKGITANSIEAALNLPNASISLSKDRVSKKHLGIIVKYLEDEYGFTPDYKGKPNVSSQRRWMDGWQFGASDNEERFRDPDNGLWKRVKDYGMAKDKDGRLSLKDGFKAVDGEAHQDNTGEYYIAKNGLKVYYKYKYEKPFKL